jgi:hypothetical protein
MKDLILIPAIVPLLANVSGDMPAWQHLGISALSVAATVGVWKYFTAREAAAAEIEKKRREKLDAEDMAERNRLLEQKNRLSEQVVQLLKDQITISTKNGLK